MTIGVMHSREIGAAAMAQRVSGIKISGGFVSETGPRKRNEDFAGAVFGPELPKPRRDVVAAISDGIGSSKGGREAAEIAVRGFLDGFCDLPETMEVRRAAAIVLNALNGWIHSQGRRDPADRKSTRLNSSHSSISYAVFCLKKKNKNTYYIYSEKKKKKKQK